MKGKRRALDPRSGNQLVDAIFRELIVILERQIERIKKKENLRSPHNKRERLWGFLVPGHSEIYLEARAKPDGWPITFYLIHELVHALCSDASERRVDQMTHALWRQFTEDQKKILKAYIPRHKVKKGPESAPKE